MMNRIQQAFAATLALLLLASTGTAWAQSRVQVTGTVLDEVTGERLVGANVRIKDRLVGAVTNNQGVFNLDTEATLPFTLVISYIGYRPSEVEINQSRQEVNVRLDPDVTVGNEVVVAASRVEESYLESPVSVQQLSALELQTDPAVDAYSAIANLKGVQMSTGSLTFSSVNTRGFADMQNWRFVQLVDGMDMAPPGLNYALGSNSSVSDLDLASIELVPGPGSALYGANAFNGVLVLRTKSPFLHKGLSAYVRGGATEQTAAGTNGFVDFGARYAETFGDRFALKANVTYLSAEDWQADDRSFYISPQRVSQREQLLDTPRTDPNYDAVNVYGDEVQVPVNLGGEQPALINRSGIPEEDIIDYGVENLRLQGSLHYRLAEGVEAFYDYRYMTGDAILRHTTIYPLVNFQQQLHKLEVAGNTFFLRGYYSQEDAKDSYAMLVTGRFIQEGLKPSELWAAEYGAAFRGEVSGVEAESHAAARAYADRDIPGPNSEIFQTLRDATLSNSDISTGGSKFVDKTAMWHLEGNYNLSSYLDVVDVQVGANFRQYILDSEGQLFNDGPLGFDDPIPVNEYGAYTQAALPLVNDRLKLAGSIRYDKNENFDARFTPRGSAVFVLGPDREHALRVSGQTGFRNPAAQETYIALDIGAAILLGGVEDNIENYSVQAPDGSIIDGRTLHEGLVTLPSFQQFAATGDPTVLEPANLAFLEQERISTLEFGYRGRLGARLLVDVNYYHNWYNDFVSRVTTVSPQAGRAFAVYTNIDQQITSQGAGADIEYVLPGNYRLGGSYSYAWFDAEEAVDENPGFLPSFNTPEHRFNLSFGNRDAYRGFGFSVKYRWSDEYFWQSPFGVGLIDSYSVLDVALLYEVSEIGARLKVGAANLLDESYRQVYGGPEVGSQYYLGLTFDNIVQAIQRR